MWYHKFINKHQCDMFRKKIINDVLVDSRCLNHLGHTGKHNDREEMIVNKNKLMDKVYICCLWIEHYRREFNEGFVPKKN